MAKANIITKPENPHAARDALPFFKKGTEKVSAVWWHVKPTGNYIADFETGKSYAREFAPFLTKNVGSAMLVWIVRDMAKKAGSKGRIDGIATGFLHGVVNVAQAAMFNLVAARDALDAPKSRKADALRKSIDNGTAFFVLNPASLHRDPSSSIFERGQA